MQYKLNDFDCVWIERLTEARVFNVTTSNYKGYGHPKAEPRQTIKEAIELVNEWALPGMAKYYWHGDATGRQVLDDVTAVQLILTYGDMYADLKR